MATTKTAKTTKKEKNTETKITTTVVKKTSTKKTTLAKKATPKTNTTKKNTSAKKTTAKTNATKKRNSKKVPNIIEYYDLPDKYDKTMVKLLFQTPKRLFVYWEISEADKKAFIEKNGEDFFENGWGYPLTITDNF